MSTRYAIIGGSQGFQTVQKLGKSASLGQVDTPFGSSAPVHRMLVNGEEVLFLSRHGEKGYSVSAPFVNYRANIWALKELGVSRIISWSGPGAIDSDIPIGDILVPRDIIDETRGRDYTFFNGLGIGFIRQNPVFCPDLSATLQTVITEKYGHCRNKDVYVCTQGPRLETPAEIRKFASFGGTLVGMTLVPEAFLAKELEMCYCPLCYVVNYAEGVVDRPYRPGIFFEGMLTEDEKVLVDRAVESLSHIAVETFARLNESKECRCALSMERYRRRGDISDDWHNWILPQ